MTPDRRDSGGQLEDRIGPFCSCPSAPGFGLPLLPATSPRASRPFRGRRAVTPGRWTWRRTCRPSPSRNDQTFWDEFCARHGLSDNAARMLRLVGPDTLVEFAAWAADEREFFFWLQGFSSPGGQRWVVCPRALRVNDRRALLAMWRQARVHLDWLAEDTPGRAYAHDPLWGLPSLPARWAPQWAVHTHQTGDSDDDPMFGCILDADIPEFEPPHPVLEWPVVPTGDFAPGTFNRRDYYLARLGPWARVVHSPRREGEEDTVARCGRRIERDMALAMVWPPPAAELGGLPWQWCRECWAGRCISRGDHENDLIPELE